MSVIDSTQIYLQVKLPCCGVSKCTWVNRTLCVKNVIVYWLAEVSVRVCWLWSTIGVWCTILNNVHEHGPINNKISLLKQVNKGPSMKSFEQFYIQVYSYNNNQLFPENSVHASTTHCTNLYDLQLCHACVWSSCKCNVPEPSKS
jgi:hypothetical protein